MTWLPCEENPDAWFTTSTEEAAKAACEDCPARDACLELALAGNERWGVWGGLTVEERDKLAAPDPEVLPGMPQPEEPVVAEHDRGAYVAKAHGDHCRECAAANAKAVAEFRAKKRARAQSQAEHAGRQTSFDMEAIA